MPVFNQNNDNGGGQRNFNGDSQNARSERDNYLNKFTANQANDRQTKTPTNQNQVKLNIESSVTLDNQYQINKQINH